MLESEKLALAAHLHVVLRRHVGRVTDVEWLVRDAAYAQEIIALARASGQADCVERANRLAEALFPPPPPAAPVRPAATPSSPLGVAMRRYVGSLR
ncbi:hypothetical protein KAK07_21690 [Ideonella sp. 4Y16]|uniref:Uncharacterized protein n=1 Tax=Ideonella alba TaxID=2824118 RepID=A0A940YDW6_9BURK|nr:hypothetical protein [Ideonella alba]MBQ0932815.1 hypothetical protein [Ideonella alba]MBQ0945969.1 hypothetical protein [Ideonella alba]